MDPLLLLLTVTFQEFVPELSLYFTIECKEAQNPILNFLTIYFDHRVHSNLLIFLFFIPGTGLGARRIIVHLPGTLRKCIWGFTLWDFLILFHYEKPSHLGSI